MLAALRYRWVQALVLILLAALVTACSVMAPLYNRAVDQAMVAATLEKSTSSERGLRLSSGSSSQPVLALSSTALDDLVPDTIREYFEPPIAGSSVTVRRMPLLGEPEGRLVYRAGMCDHVRFVSGRCPARAREIAISAAQAKAYKQGVGASVALGEFDGSVSRPEASPRARMRITGIYEQAPAPYWFGEVLTGRSDQLLGFDAMLTPEATLTEPADGPEADLQLPWTEVHHSADLALRSDRVGADQIAALGRSVDDLVKFPMGVDRAGTLAAATVTAGSELPSIAREVATGADQAGLTIPLLMAQLGLLLGCVLWLVLVAAADQRRGEVALARLRGRGARGGRRLLLIETLPPVVVGAPLGAALALGLCSLARHRVLTGRPPLEIPQSAWVGLGIAVAAMVALAVLAAARVCREPVSSLVRSVPPRRTSAGLGVLEAALVAAAGAAFLALVTGSVGGPVGQVAPTLLAVAVAVVLARVLPAGFTVIGRALLRSGRAASGAALLAAGRRGSTRWLIPVVTVAMCLVVVSADALAVGARNRLGRAEVEVGAPTVLHLDTEDLATVVAAVRTADPAGAHVTPVAIIDPVSADQGATIGVVPDAFRRLALWPGADPGGWAWDRLTAPETPPLRLTGTRITYRLTAPEFTSATPDLLKVPDALEVAINVVGADGRLQAIPIGALPRLGADAPRSATIPCQDTCRIAGLGVLAPQGSTPVTGEVSLTEVHVDGRGIDMGDSRSWTPTTVDGTDLAGEARSGGLTLRFSNGGVDQAFLPHASMPAVVPTLTTPADRPSAAGATYAGSYLDGETMMQVARGDVPFVPGGPDKASLVNLDNLLAQGWRGRGAATVLVYADSIDPAILAPVTARLADAGVHVTETRHPGPVAQAYGRSAAAWSLGLAFAVGGFAVLVAAVGVIVLAVTSWRARTRDYAGLRLAGTRPRSLAVLAQLETLPVILVSAGAGAAAGLWAAPPAVAMMPMFTSPPPTYLIDLHTAWLPALSAAAAGLAVLLLVGALAGRPVATRSDVSRLRDSA